MEEVIRGKLSGYAGRKSETQQTTKGRDEAAAAGTILSRIDSPADLKALTRAELLRLCDELREFIIDVVSQKGGHLGASLGVVELTVALQTVLNLPNDRIIWDTGHQAYVHKVLTGRRQQLWTIRQQPGISGFLKRDESPYDTFGAGHASTSISAALGMATARDLAQEQREVVAVLGDGAMTGGLAYEALNNAGQSKRKLLVVLNDNGMSIAPNVGAISHYLTDVVVNPHFRKLRDEALEMIKKLPAFGQPMGQAARKLEQAVKNALVPGGLFEALGFSYIGPIDGHDLNHLLDVLPRVLEREGPVLLHVKTEKGRGLAPAKDHVESFHASQPFDKLTGKALAAAKKGALPSYTKVYGAAMLEAAEAFPKMIAITAAMPSGTGLTELMQRYPERCVDVGIAEAHGICFAAGLACDGARPVATIYSTFMQRAYDQIIHDVALQKLPVVFAMDRAGLVGADGPTHHGVLDISFMRCIPGMTVTAPKDGNELKDLLWTALSHDGPFSIRYPRGSVPASYDPDRKPQRLPLGSWELLREGKDVALLAVGTMVETALAAAATLEQRGCHATVVNCRFVKPMDTAMLRQLREEFGKLVTLEENARPGGFGDGVLEELDHFGLSHEGITRIALPDAFVGHGTRDQLLQELGLTADQIADRVAADL